jgi:hypothetical protein
MEVSAQLQTLASLTPERERGIPVNRRLRILRSRPARVGEEQTLSPLPGLQPGPPSRYPRDYTDSAVMTSCLVGATLYLFICDCIYVS